MKNKVVVITGANVGIGFETAVGLASLGATTVLACRNRAKADAAALQVKERSGNAEVHPVDLDLSDLTSVRACAETIKDSWDRLDVLINNAGGIWSSRETTAQGFEQTFGVNHLGHFYLTNLLLDRLVDSAPARIINLSSFGHHLALGGMQWDNLQYEKRYTSMSAYSQSKLANVLFTRGLAKRLDPEKVVAHAVHPGPVRSGFGMDGDMKGIQGLVNRLIRPFEISAASGAKTSIFVASDPSAAKSTGSYWVRSKRGHMSRHAQNDAEVERLWTESEKLLASVGAAIP